MMPPVQTALIRKNWLNWPVYPLTKRFLALPEKIADCFVSNSKVPKGPVRNGVESLGKFLGKLADWDFRSFQGWITNAPLGAACFLFFGAMMGTRLKVAFERGRKNGNDFREVKDILIRDTIAISLFVFGLNMITNAVNRLSQKLPGTGGLRLFDPKSRELLDYSRFANYLLDSERALVGLVREGGAEGLKRAFRKLYAGGLSEMGGEPVKKRLDAIVAELPELIRLMESHPHGSAKDNEAVTAKAREIFKHIEAGDGVLEELLRSAKETGLKTSIKAAEKVQGTFRNAVIKYAQGRRLPADVLGFGIVILMLGWFPGWFNARRNKQDFEKAQRQSQAGKAAAYDPRATWQGFQGSSRLAQGYRARAFQPQGMASSQNPFASNSFAQPQQY